MTTKITLTAAEAKEHSDSIGRALKGEDFDQIVLLVTVDHVLWCSSAKYQKYGDHHFVWTEHHGHFFEHKDEVAKLHVIRAKPADWLHEETATDD